MAEALQNRHGRDKPGHEADGGASVPEPTIARTYTLTIWGIALGILIQAVATVAWALAIGNAQLFKDGVDWVYDVALYGLAAVLFGRGEGAERVGAMIIAAVLFVAGAHTVYDLHDKIVQPRPIEPMLLGFAAISAIVIAWAILLALWPFRRIDHPLVLATWVSSRNDAIATTAYQSLLLAARLVPGQRWPEWALDAFAAALNAQAVHAILASLARRSRADKTPG